MIQLFLGVIVSQQTVLLFMDVLAVRGIDAYNATASINLTIIIHAHTV